MSAENDFRRWVRERFHGADVVRSREGCMVFRSGNYERVVESGNLDDAARGELVHGIIPGSETKTQRAAAVKDYHEAKAKKEHDLKRDLNKEAVRALKHRNGGFLGLTKRGKAAPYHESVRKLIGVIPHWSQPRGG